MKPKIEMRIYEAFGVRLFRKMVFSLEKLIHRKDNELNSNYHIPYRDISAIDAFIKYLFYNGSIHVRNLVYFALYCLLKVIFHWRLRFFDLLLGLLAIKDIYCVMLQRYNLLRISQCKKQLLKLQENKQQKQLEKCRQQFEATYDSSHAEADLAVVRRLKNCLENRESIILSDEDVAVLNRLLLVSTKNP